MLMITIQGFAIQRRTNHTSVISEGRRRINDSQAVTSSLFQKLQQWLYPHVSIAGSDADAVNRPPLRTHPARTIGTSTP
jgi:hypothetical protein